MEGIIYKTQPYQEHARLLFVYTPAGKKTLLAQGAQKLNHPNRILAQYLTHIAFKDRPKSFLTLMEPKLINEFANLKSDYAATKSAALILEAIDKLIIEDQPHAVIFSEALQAISAPHIVPSGLSFVLKLFKPLGYALDLQPDGRSVIGVNIEKGGLVYKGESAIIDLDTKGAVELLKLLMSPYEMLIPLDLIQTDQIKAFVLKYCLFHLQTTLKTLQ